MTTSRPTPPPAVMVTIVVVSLAVMTAGALTVGAWLNDALVRGVTPSLVHTYWALLFTAAFVGVACSAPDRDGDAVSPRSARRFYGFMTAINLTTSTLDATGDNVGWAVFAAGMAAACFAMTAWAHRAVRAADRMEAP